MTYPKMNPKVKQKLIAALRSGEYKQGNGRLRNVADKFCCLGVLCNIHAQENPEFAETQRTRGLYDSSYYTLGKNVQTWSQVYNATNKLIDMNDTECRSFKQIANWIEKNL